MVVFLLTDSKKRNQHRLRESSTSQRSDKQQSEAWWFKWRRRWETRGRRQESEIIACRTTICATAAEIIRITSYSKITSNKQRALLYIIWISEQRNTQMAGFRMAMRTKRRMIWLARRNGYLPRFRNNLQGWARGQQMVKLNRLTTDWSPHTLHFHEMCELSRTTWGRYFLTRSHMLGDM